MVYKHVLNDPVKMMIAREESWLCELFQTAKLKKDIKKKILTELLTEEKNREKEKSHGQRN